MFVYYNDCLIVDINIDYSINVTFMFEAITPMGQLNQWPHCRVHNVTYRMFCDMHRLMASGPLGGCDAQHHSKLRALKSTSVLKIIIDND